MPDDLTKTEADALPDDIKAIVEKVRAKQIKRQRHEHICGLCFVTSFLVSPILGILLQDFRISLFLLFLSLAIPVHSNVRDATEAKKGNFGLDREDIALLSTVNDKRIVGILLDDLPSRTEKDYFPERNDLFPRLFSLLTPEDTYILTQKQKDKITSLVLSKNKEVVLGAFYALEQIGNKNQILDLKIWRGSQLRRSLKPWALEACATCIAAIEARLVAERSNSQLLRPAPLSAQSDLLLRPATQKPDEDTNTLLRAEIGEKTD